MSNVDSQLLRYALGKLAPAERANIEHQLERSDTLRAELKQVRSLFDALVEYTEPAPVRPEVRDRLLQGVEADFRHEGFVTRLAELFDLGVDRIRDLLKSTLAEHRDRWEKSPSPGIELLHFAGGPAVAKADCGLVRVKRGTEFPYHTHMGTETALVIAGCLEDCKGSVLCPGDLSVMQAGSGHTFTATGNEDLLLAVVINNGLSFAARE